MQSASPRTRIQLGGELVMDRARDSLRGGLLWSAILSLLLTLAIARSTAAAGWVGGIDVITPIALAGAVLVGVLALLPIPWPAGLGAGLVLAPIVAWNGASAAIHQAHPLDGSIVGPAGLSLHPLAVWWSRVVDGSASTDPSFYLFLICALMWVTGAWLTWCVLRWRKPMLGLIPGAAAFATNLLNDIVPGDQNGYTLSVLVLTLALLLWSNYSGSVVSADRAHVKLTGDARWDFWESGLVAMAALIVLGIMLPPLSTVDRTVDAESSLFTNWAVLQERLSHPGIVTGNGSGITGTTGFSTDVPLDGALLRTRDIVFTYKVVGTYAGPRYFRGVDETVTQAGEWRYAGLGGLNVTVHKNQVPVFGEDYQALAEAGFDIQMLGPPIGNANILFYPDELLWVDRESSASQVPLRVDTSGQLLSIDRLSTLSPPTSSGAYKVAIQYSTATEAQLKAAGTSYPDWVEQFATLPASTYRSPAVLARVHALAQSIVDQAGAVTPYDRATAIEAYLRDNFTYTLTPPRTPAGRDPIDYFLFGSKQGYCEFFASAMGDMLRSLGIPTRLVNGFGPGQFDQASQSYVVRGEDAHTWVESYFPTYGWIPFEPTPASGGYTQIARGTSGENLCVRDNGCDISVGGGAGGGVGLVGPGRQGGNQNAGSLPGGGASFALHIPDASTLTKVVAVLLALVLLLLAALTRYLRPRTVMAVWRRTLSLASLAGAERRPGETPLELGRRLQRTFPEAAEPVGALATGFVVAAYAPPEEASTTRASVMEAWASLRPLMLRRVFARFRPNRHPESLT
ncbi:MAG TPA: transglutaminase domain-containing protein [Candidatus Dormibacteraeota bacterium]|nr:transglutaminase domain-containing protein [Candidatus Dormibacteraeota bacterium]